MCIVSTKGDRYKETSRGSGCWSVATVLAPTTPRVPSIKRQLFHSRLKLTSQAVLLLLKMMLLLPCLVLRKMPLPTCVVESETWKFCRKFSSWVDHVLNRAPRAVAHASLPWSWVPLTFVSAGASLVPGVSPRVGLWEKSNLCSHLLHPQDRSLQSLFKPFRAPPAPTRFFWNEIQILGCERKGHWLCTSSLQTGLPPPVSCLTPPPPYFSVYVSLQSAYRSNFPLFCLVSPSPQVRWLPWSTTWIHHFCLCLHAVTPGSQESRDWLILAWWVPSTEPGI